MNKTYLPDVADALAANWFSSQLVSSETAGTDVTDAYLGTVSRSQLIGEVWITPVSAGLTSSDTLAVTFTISKKTADGTDATLATIQTKTSVGGGSGSWTQFTPVKCTLAAGAFLSAQDVVVVSTTHLSTGTATPSFTVQLVPAMT